MVDLVNPTLLPPPLARDLSSRALETIAARISTLDLSALVVYDFDAVSASALPSLAEQFRVLGDAGWNLATTEAQQRALLKEAIALHRLRGTPYAVTRVLAILGLNADMIEWFESNPQGAPYTFTVSMDALEQPDGSVPLDLNRLAQVARCVNYWKNARSSYAFRITSAGIELGTGITMVVGGQTATSITAEFDGELLSMSSFVAMNAGGAASQAIGATFA
ncbi:phage tail protein I [Burkholderia cenocepacia]|uniref:phage tail protein I n=1 Tax=Burkholderia cenocepacia TaxID=95486 RepID=UPI001AA0C0D5|nr:phage tail protein I [Burkholderia cenocepacia]MBO1856859.1 phage tail protein I [Burkholderia cenocepacia]